jgi:hypothetical protein
MRIKEELIKAVNKLFDDFEEMEDITYERVQWELDYMVYPYIGSFLASGDISKDDAIEIFNLCESRLKELKLKLDNV